MADEQSIARNLVRQMSAEILAKWSFVEHGSDVRPELATLVEAEVYAERERLIRIAWGREACEAPLP